MTAAARASAKGKRILRDALPPALFGWIDTLARTPKIESQEVYALAGFLAAVAVELQKCYQSAGSEVRELIWGLHNLLKPDPARQLPPQIQLNPISRASLDQIGADFGQWLQEKIASDSGPQYRSVMIHWIDIANERLTMRAYHRSDQRARQAAILIANPMALVFPSAEDQSIRMPWAELVLRFFDLLQATDQAQMGRNRIAPPSNFGGFYGVTAPSNTPSEADIATALDQLDKDLAGLNHGAFSYELKSILEAATERMSASLKIRRKTGEWPSDFANAFGGKGSFWKTVLRLIGI